MTKTNLTKADIFIGPIIRRASTELVVIQVATFAEVNLQFSCRMKATTKGPSEWIGHDVKPQCVQALPGLFFYYGRIKPDHGRFPPAGCWSTASRSQTPREKSPTTRFSRQWSRKRSSRTVTIGCPLSYSGSHPKAAGALWFMPKDSRRQRWQGRCPGNRRRTCSCSRG